MDIKIPAFRETTYSDNYINKTSRVINISNVHEKDFASYCEIFNNHEFVRKEGFVREFHSYAGYFKNNTGVFLNYYNKLNELNIAIEEDCKYFFYSDNFLGEKISPQITQVHLEDYGMSYVVRLSDGRFIVIDGGWNFKPDAQSLFDTLKEGSTNEKPVIAAWIMTHAHCDHYRCFNEFTKFFCDDVIIEKFLLNFPDHKKYIGEKFKRIPEIKDEDYCFENSSDYIHINLMYENIIKYKSDVYMPHTGQKYKIGDAECEFLSTIDDTHYISQDDNNAASLVFRMKLAGQIILWTGDASFSASRLYEKYGTYLKSDILQIPHHGFGSGKDEAQIKCYDLIKPDVCMMPVSDYNAYISICTHVKGTRNMMANPCVCEMITGEKQRTITLPYIPPAQAKVDLKEKYTNGLKSIGSTSWVYTGFNTINKEDFIFTCLNMTHFETTVLIELLFENSENRITNISAKIPAYTFREICITDKLDVELNSAFFNWNSINIKGLPENVPFAVHFFSETPVVISHKTHKPAYTK